MENRYLIRGKSKEATKWKYYSIDNHSDYPCWLSSSFSGKVMGERDLMDTIRKIKDDFSRQGGTYYNRDIEGDTLEYIKIAYVEPRKISEVTEGEMMWPEIERLLTEEQLGFIKNMIKGKTNAN